MIEPALQDEYLLDFSAIFYSRILKAPCRRFTWPRNSASDVSATR
jgi:hypothetical protein